MARYTDTIIGIGAFTALSLIVATVWLSAVPAIARHVMTERAPAASDAVPSSANGAQDYYPNR